VRINKLGVSGLVGLALLAPRAVSAHPGGHAADDLATGLWSGLLHPVTGLDHVFTMVIVGMLAWQLGGRALYLVPGAFVTMMALGGAIGAAGISFPFAEVGIALSMVVLGAVVALGIRLPAAIAIGMVGLFAVFHGYAHGVEMPENAAGVGYGLGFMVATAVLHTAGIAVGFTITHAGGKLMRPDLATDF
jgi:urease accessory protein